MKTNYWAVLLFTVSAAVMSVHADQSAVLRQVPGEITWIDTKLGKLQFKSDASPSTGEVTEYRINQNETRVTDPTDKKFLTIEDLLPGQHITLDVVNGQEERTLQKITADPRRASDYQEAYGEISAIDVPAGTLTLTQRTRVGETVESYPSYYVFEPNDIIAMQSPSRNPVQLNVKPGDSVKVEFLEKDRKQWAHSITLYSPKMTSTTTTTTTTTTQ